MSDQPERRPEEMSTYVFKWGIYSWVCVGVGAAFALMWAMQSDSLVPGLIVGALIAIIGGILLALTPRAALNQSPRPMTPKARAKAAAKRSADDSPRRDS